MCVINQEEVRKQVRRNINGSESKEILKEKSSKKKDQQIYIIELEKSSVDGLLKRDFGYVWLMKQILSESERVIRFRSLRSSTTFAPFISFSHSQYEKCFHPLICNSNQFWIVDAIWKFRKILIISWRIRPPVVKRPRECSISVN